MGKISRKHYLILPSYQIKLVGFMVLIVFLGSLLHGFKEGIVWDLLVSPNIVRDVIYNMEPVHFLLPSQAYTEKVIDIGSEYTELIKFNESLVKFPDPSIFSEKLDLNLKIIHYM